MHPHGRRPQHPDWERYGEGGGFRREQFFRHFDGGRGEGRGGSGGHGPGHGPGHGRGHGRGYGHGGRGGRGFERGFGGMEGRGEGKRFFMRGEFKFALLELLASAPMHGYQMIKAMEEKTGGLYTPSAGSIYPNLQLLEEMQLIRSTEADGKKLYEITEEGKAHLQEREKAAPARPDERWDRRGHRPGPAGEVDKRDLRRLVVQWPETVGLLGHAARAVQESPDAESSAKLREIVEKLREDLKQALRPDHSGDGTESAPTEE
ncbi:PadR family transcriptional regulator [Cohnella sp. AR92]|nr:PadR family transcriptional regulator [Cohnella sp. AR92]